MATETLNDSNSDVLYRVMSGPASRGQLGEESLSADLFRGTINPVNAWHLIPELFGMGLNSMMTAIEDAAEDELPMPEESAIARAEREIFVTANLLAEGASFTKKPVISVAVRKSGAIEIVGYYHGVLGRRTTQVDGDGTCVMVRYTQWPTL